MFSKKLGASSYSVHKRMEDIQLEIMNNGPVEGALTVYEDFPTYKSGMEKSGLFFFLHHVFIAFLFSL